jgi:hypothetical protein
MEGKSPGRFLFGVCVDMDNERPFHLGWILSPPASGDIPHPLIWRGIGKTKNLSIPFLGE